MRVLILGAGPAGLTLVERLRTLERQARVGNAACEIEMVSDEDHPPYSPPALADHFLTGRDTTLFWKGQDAPERLGVVHRRGRAVQAVHPADRCVTLADGSRLSYDRLVIATGSRLHAPLPGADLPGLCNFKSLTAARALVERVRRGEAQSALVVGAGFIGVEVALVLCALGLAVTLLERDWVMASTLERETADLVRAALCARGIRVLDGQAAAAFEGRDRVEAVRLTTGEPLTADIHIAATGVKPNIDALAGSGLDLGWGLRVDERLDTNLPDIHAAGDVAETRDRLTGERRVHAYFPNAVEQGRVLAERLFGLDTRYAGAECINSLRHLGLALVAAGRAHGEALCLRDGPILRKVYLEDGRIQGFRLAGDIRGAGVYRALMLQGADVRPYGTRLLDPAFAAGSVAFDALRAGGA